MEWTLVSQYDFNSFLYAYERCSYRSRLVRSAEELVIAAQYPATHPIERLVRIVRPVKDAPAVEFELHVFARQQVW